MKKLCIVLMLVSLMGAGCANLSGNRINISENGGVYTYLDENNSEVELKFRDGLALMVIPKSEGTEVWQYVDKDGKVILKPDCYRADSFGEGYAAIKFTEDGKWGYINKKGEVVIPAQYDLASMFKNGEATVHINGNGGKWVVINKQGDILRELSEPENWESDVQGTPSKETEFLY